MVTRGQAIRIALVAAFPFLCFVVLALVSPGYMGQLVTNRSCGLPMLAVAVVFQLVVAVLLLLSYRGWNRAVAALPDDQQPGGSLRIVLILVQLFAIVLLAGSMWIVLLGPAVIQLMDSSNRGTS